MSRRHCRPMRQTPLSSNRVETTRRFRLFPRSACVLVWQLVFVWNPSNAPAQSGFLASPRELLAMDPPAFAEWLDSNRSKPMAEEERARIFGSLPRQGRRTHFDAAGRQKLAGMQAFLRAAGHDSMYESFGSRGSTVTNRRLRAQDHPGARTGTEAAGGRGTGGAART